MRHFLQLSDFEPDEFEHLFRRTKLIKDRFKRYEAYQPLVENGAPSKNGNWELSMAEATMAIAVFLDEQEIFQRALSLWERCSRSRQVPGAVFVPNPRAYRGRSSDSFVCRFRRRSAAALAHRAALDRLRTALSPAALLSARCGTPEPRLARTRYAKLSQNQ